MTLSSSQFEAFYHKLQKIRLQKTPNSIAKKEEKVLKKIHTPFAKKKNFRFNLLIAKRDTQSLSKEEYQELLELTEAFEKFELKRLKLLAKLADLRKISLPEVLNLYNIRPTANS